VVVGGDGFMVVTVRRVYRLRSCWCKTCSYAFVVCGLTGFYSVFDARFVPVLFFAVVCFAAALIPAVYVELVDVVN
jgi:hypothetical protein